MAIWTRIARIIRDARVKNWRRERERKKAVADDWPFFERATKCRFNQGFVPISPPLSPPPRYTFHNDDNWQLANQLNILKLQRNFQPGEKLDFLKTFFWEAAMKNRRGNSGVLITIIIIMVRERIRPVDQCQREPFHQSEEGSHRRTLAGRTLACVEGTRLYEKLS